MSSIQPYVAGTAFPVTDTSAVAPDAADFGGIVVNETWAQLEPTAGSYDWSDLDASLAAVAAYNAQHAADPLSARLRIFGGYAAPGWAKSLSGGPVALPASTGRTTLGRWWTSDYRAAWSQFEHALAARYDDDPLVHEVAVTSCSTLSGEPFVQSLGARSIPVLLAAGWSSGAQQACLSGALGDYSGWHRTAVDYPLNGFRDVVGGRPVTDEAFTETVLSACVASTAPRCLPGNHGLQDGSTTGRSAPLYSAIEAMAAVSYFQTYGPSQGDDCASIAIAVAHHADSVELWPSRAGITGFGSLSASTLAELDRALVTHTAPSCT